MTVVDAEPSTDPVTPAPSPESGDTDGAQAPLPAAGREGKRADLVQAMFDSVAPRYDLANDILSMGQAPHWRRVTAIAARPADAELLDVAAGPGNVAVELLARGARQVTALDLSYEMVREGAGRGHEGIRWINGDAQRLPLPDASMDAATISFGLRNVPDPGLALRELARVLRPGGRVVIAEFASPTNPVFRTIYRRYLVGALPQVARVVSSSPDAYRYLADSILAWPTRREVADWLEDAGFVDVMVKDLAGGIVAVHRGFKP